MSNRVFHGVLAGKKGKKNRNSQVILKQKKGVSCNNGNKKGIFSLQLIQMA